MCKICEPILGVPMKSHKENECPLKQGAYCPLCASRGHFTSDCPKRPSRVLSDKDEPISTTTHRTEQERTYQMAENDDAYVEYMRLYGQESTLRKDRNKAFVMNHLKERGYTLVHPPSKPTTPSV